MKRFHVHLAVRDLAASVRFYSELFGQAPTKQREDYAKWTLEDPRLNFAISARGRATGIDHLGMEAESEPELARLRELADAAAEGAAVDQGLVDCCYASSAKHWVADPQGIAWEHFRTLADSDSFAAATTGQHGEAGVAAAPRPPPTVGDAGCCRPGAGSAGESGCCK